MIQAIGYVLKNSQHNGTHLLAMIIFADYANEDGDSYPSMGALARKLRLCERRARQIVADLEASGELVRYVNDGAKTRNGQHTNRYHITGFVDEAPPLVEDEGESPAENSIPRKQRDAENSPTFDGKRGAENSPLIPSMESKKNPSGLASKDAKGRSRKKAAGKTKPQPVIHDMNEEIAPIRGDVIDLSSYDAMGYDYSYHFLDSLFWAMCFFLTEESETPHLMSDNDVNRTRELFIWAMEFTGKRLTPYLFYQFYLAYREKYHGAAMPRYKDKFIKHFSDWWTKEGDPEINNAWLRAHVVEGDRHEPE